MITLPAFLTHGTAHCTTTPDLFHSTHPTDQAEAIRICHDCPLRTACAHHALTTPEPDGTWGGLTARDRRRILNPDDHTWLDDQGRVRVPCGSYQALQAHLRYGEECQACRVAQAARTEEQRRARLAEEHAAGGTVTGAVIHRRLGEPVCVRCGVAQARQSAVRRESKRAGRGELTSAA